jgi:hypothetical protein
VIENWRRLHDEEFNSFYISQNIIRMIRSRRIGWAKHVACVETKKAVYNTLVSKRKKKNHT